MKQTTPSRALDTLLGTSEVAETFAIVTNVLAGHVIADPRFIEVAAKWDAAMGNVIWRAREIRAWRQRGTSGDIDIDAWFAEVIAPRATATRVLRGFVCSLGLPYPWLTLLLSGVLRVYACALATGEGFPIGMAAALPALNPGEDLASYQRRIRRVGKRRPKANGAHLARWVDWYYRTRIKFPKGPGDSIRALAKEEQRRRTAAGGNSRVGVQYAVRRIEAVLQSSDCYYPSPRPN